MPILDGEASQKISIEEKSKEKKIDRNLKLVENKRIETKNKQTNV